MAAMIRCCCHIDPSTLDEDNFAIEYNRAKIYMKIVNQVRFE